MMATIDLGSILYPVHVTSSRVDPLAVAPRPDRRAVSDWTLDRLSEMVFTGELKAGDVLSEVELTERLQVSRSPIREALRELENAGLLDVDAVNGRRVLRPFVAADVAELYDIRAELEGLTARYAASVPDRSFTDGLDGLIEEMQAALREPVETWLPTDFAFHAAISAASGTRRAPHLLAGLWIQNQALLRRMALVGSYPSTLQERRIVIAEHRDIVRAIAEGDPEKAEAAARAHLQHRAAKILDSLDASGTNGI